MKSIFACITVATLIAVPAIAVADDRVAVLAVDRSTGSLTLGDVVAYKKTFDVSLTNTSNEAIDLTAICLVAQTADGERFGLDTVDESLTTGNLETGGTATGIATFASKAVTVLDAASVHVSSAC
jgi:hypothetical protein